VSKLESINKKKNIIPRKAYIIFRIENPYLITKANVIPTNTPLDPVVIEMIKNKKSKKFSKFVFSSLLSNKKANPTTVKEASMFGFQIIPLYLVEKISGLINKPIITIKPIR